MCHPLGDLYWLSEWNPFTPTRTNTLMLIWHVTSYCVTVNQHATGEPERREGTKGILHLVNMSLLALTDSEIVSVVPQHFKTLILQYSHSQGRCKNRWMDFIATHITVNKAINGAALQVECVKHICFNHFHHFCKEQILISISLSHICCYKKTNGPLVNTADKVDPVKWGKICKWANEMIMHHIPSKWNFCKHC